MGANSDAGAANPASRRSPGMVRPPEMLSQGYLDHKKRPLPVGTATRGASSQCVVLFPLILPVPWPDREMPTWGLAGTPWLKYTI